jgi:membrane-associated protease RseP (regulator of RpoE activity)
MWSNTVAVTRTLATFPLRVFSAFDDSLSGRERNMEDPVGLVGAGRIGADIGSADVPASYRLGQLLTLIAGLNISLAVFNLIPLLPLDGGHVALAFVDAARNATARLRRRPTPEPFDANRLLPLTRLVVTFLIVSSVILLFVDIANPVGVGR